MPSGPGPRCGGADPPWRSAHRASPSGTRWHTALACNFEYIVRHHRARLAADHGAVLHHRQYPLRPAPAPRSDPRDPPRRGSGPGEGRGRMTTDDRRCGQLASATQGLAARFEPKPPFPFLPSGALAARLIQVGAGRSGPLRFRQPLRHSAARRRRGLRGRFRRHGPGRPGSGAPRTGLSGRPDTVGEVGGLHLSRIDAKLLLAGI
jgi:hypothetical protein